MATWDGSYPEPEPESNYYVNSNRNHIAVNISALDYYLSNIDSTYAQNTTIPYSLNTSSVFESNIPNFFNNDDRNNIPFISNITSTNSDMNSGMQTFTDKVS
jgi:hypothetical protein